MSLIIYSSLNLLFTWSDRIAIHGCGLNCHPYMNLFFIEKKLVISPSLCPVGHIILFDKKQM